MLVDGVPDAMVVRDGQMAYVLRGTCSSPLLITTDTCDPRASVMLKPSTERCPPSTTVLRGFDQAIPLPRRTLGIARHPSSGRITSRRWGKQRPITQIAELYEDKSNFPLHCPQIVVSNASDTAPCCLNRTRGVSTQCKVPTPLRLLVEVHSP